MVSFLGLRNTWMAKLGPANCHEWSIFNARSLPKECKRQCKRTVSWEANTSGLHDYGQGHPQDAQSSFRRLSLCFPTTYTHPGLNCVTLLFHPLKGSLSVHCISLGEYDASLGLLRL